jgi:dUTP pyrophosphatase
MNKMNTEFENNSLRVKHEQKIETIFYSVQIGCNYHPKCAYNSPGIDLPVQTNITLDPAQREILETGITFYIPPNYYGQIQSRSSTAKLELWVHHGIIDNDYSGTIKLSIKNLDDKPVHIKEGDFLAQLLILPILHPKLHILDSIEVLSERGIGSFGSSNKPPIEESKKEPCKVSSITVPRLCDLGQSFLHEFCSSLDNNQIFIPELNKKIHLPEDPTIKNDILNELKDVELSMMFAGAVNKAAPHTHFNAEELEQSMHNFTEELYKTDSYLRPWFLRDKVSLLNNEVTDIRERELRENIVAEMCQKLAVLAVELIEDQSLSKETLSRCQRSDEYLNIIYNSVEESDNRFPNFHITKGVLFKRIYDPGLENDKSVIALPDVLMASVVHQLHRQIGHASPTSTLKNFHKYYYH